MRTNHDAQMMNLICQLMKTNSKSTSVSESTVNPDSLPSAPDFASCPANKYFHGQALEITQEQDDLFFSRVCPMTKEQDDRKSTTERTRRAVFTVRFT